MIVDIAIDSQSPITIELDFIPKADSFLGFAYNGEYFYLKIKNILPGNKNQNVIINSTFIEKEPLIN